MDSSVPYPSQYLLIHLIHHSIQRERNLWFLRGYCYTWPYKITKTTDILPNYYVDIIHLLNDFSDNTKRDLSPGFRSNIFNSLMFSTLRKWDFKTKKSYEILFVFPVHILNFHSSYWDVNFSESILNIKAFATHLNQIWFVHFFPFPLSLKLGKLIKIMNYAFKSNRKTKVNF